MSDGRITIESQPGVMNQEGTRIGEAFIGVEPLDEWSKEIIKAREELAEVSE